jgi:hypothetical protein
MFVNSTAGLQIFYYEKDIDHCSLVDTNGRHCLLYDLQTNATLCLAAGRKSHGKA